MKPPYTIEEILCLLESARMDDVSDRLRELWSELVTERARLMMERDAAEATVIKRLSAGAGEPVAWIMKNDDGDEITIADYCLRNEQPDWVQELWKDATPVYTAEQVAKAVAAERQRCLDCYSPDDTAGSYMEKIEDGSTT